MSNGDLPVQQGASNNRVQGNNDMVARSKLREQVEGLGQLMTQEYLARYKKYRMQHCLRMHNVRIASAMLN